MITVQFLGGASLRSGDSALSGPPVQRHRIALLTLIVAAWPQPLSRDRAMALLWPERDTANARRLLNLAVHVLRGALGEDAIVSTGDGLLLDPSHITCDLHDLRAAVAANDAERVAQLYTGTLLEGFHLDDSTEFGYWLDERRAELAQAYTSALMTVAERQEREGDAQGRVRTCRKLVAADPHSAAHAQALMRALDAAGDRRGAIQHAADYARRMREELDLEPDPAVAALASRLNSGARTPSVAVLPFRDLSRDPEREYFADGITEDVIAHLSKIRALKVISRSSVMPFKERLQDLKTIGRTLGATTLLDGSVRHQGDRVRIVATLIDAESERQLWADTYDRQLTDIFAIQTDVALQIASALQAELSHDEHARVNREQTTDVQAYMLYLRGRSWFIKFTPEGLMRSIEYFEQAIARDPSFALAYANMAMAYAEFNEFGAMSSDANHARGMAAVQNALRLDPNLAEAYCTLGQLKTNHEFDWPGAERAFKRALELSPSSADAYDLYGRMCGALGRHDESIALVRRAQELDPLAHRVDLATALLRAGRYEEALRSAREATEFDPDFERARATLGWALFLGGQRQEGIAELERAASLAHRYTMWLAQLGEAYGMAGRTEQARDVLRQLEQRATTEYVSPYHFAYVYTGLGEADRAIDWLERAVSERAGAVYGIKGSFLFASLHSHPRFRTLLARQNL